MLHKLFLLMEAPDTVSDYCKFLGSANYTQLKITQITFVDKTSLALFTLSNIDIYIYKK